MSAVGYCSHYLPLVLLIPLAKFAAGVVGGAPLEKFEMPLMLFSAALGKVIHEKNLKQKFRDTTLVCLPFLKLFSYTYLLFFTILSRTFHLQFSFLDRVWHLTRGSTIPTSRSLPASTAHSGSDTPAPFSFTSGSTQVRFRVWFKRLNVGCTLYPVVIVLQLHPNQYCFGSIRIQLARWICRSGSRKAKITHK